MGVVGMLDAGVWMLDGEFWTASCAMTSGEREDFNAEDEEGAEESWTRFSGLLGMVFGSAEADSIVVWLNPSPSEYG